MQPLTRRQREILDYLTEFIEHHGYSPSLEEVGRRFGLSSLATVHKHLTNLQEKGVIKRAWNRSRSVELVPAGTAGRVIEIPLQGYVAAGDPIEAVVSPETVAVPENLTGTRTTYALRVRGQSMIDEQIRRRRHRDRRGSQDRGERRDGDCPARCVRGDAQDLPSRERPCPTPARDPAMEAIVVDADRVQVQGVVIGLMRRYR